MSLTSDQNSALTPPGLPRRTILQGAAWTIPAIALATVAPAASASTAAVLTFNQASYSGTACGTITGAYVTVTVGGVPTAGRSVTTTLSDGYTFADGTTTNTQVSDTSGRVNLPAIGVGAGAGTGSITGLSGSSVATSAISAGPDAGGVAWNAQGTTATPVPGSTPAGSKAIGFNAFISPANELWINGTRVATNVDPNNAIATRDQGNTYTTYSTVSC